MGILETILNYVITSLSEGAEKGQKASSMSDAELVKKLKSGGSSLSSIKEKSMYKAERDKRHSWWYHRGENTGIMLLLSDDGNPFSQRINCFTQSGI